MGKCEFAPLCKRWRPLHEGLGSTYFSFYTFVMFSIFMSWIFSLSNLINPFELFDYLGEAISWHIFPKEVFLVLPSIWGIPTKRYQCPRGGCYPQLVDMPSMMMSKVGKPFWVVKEMHSFMLQALIEVCSKVDSFVTDLSASIGLHPSFLISKSLAFLIVPFFILTSICAIGNNIKACHTLRCHTLALKLLDIDISIEVLDTLVKVPTP